MELGWYAIYTYQRLDEPCKECGANLELQASLVRTRRFVCSGCGWEVTILSDRRGSRALIIPRDPQA